MSSIEFTTLATISICYRNNDNSAFLLDYLYYIGQQKQESDLRTIGYVLLWFIIPLLMVIGVDILVVKRRERKRAKNKVISDGVMSDKQELPQP